MNKYVVSRLTNAIDPTKRAAYDNIIKASIQTRPVSSHGKVIEIGATTSEEPIGILRAIFFPVLFYAEIVNLHVVEDQRKQDIATEMLILLQKELQKEKCPLLVYDYPSGELGTSDLEDTLKKLNWQGPRTSSVHCKFDALIFHPPWLDKVPQLIEGFSEFPWSELTRVDRIKLEHQEKQGMFPAEISPFGPNEKNIEMLNSLGLRYKGEIVGWMVTHRKAPDLILYSCFFIQKRWQMSGLAVKLLSDSIQLQLRSGVRWGALQVNVQKTEPSWMRFLERRLIPYAQEVYYSKSMWLDLSS